MNGLESIWIVVAVLFCVWLWCRPVWKLYELEGIQKRGRELYESVVGFDCEEVIAAPVHAEFTVSIEHVKSDSCEVTYGITG